MVTVKAILYISFKHVIVDNKLLNCHNGIYLDPFIITIFENRRYINPYNYTIM